MGLFARFRPPPKEEPVTVITRIMERLGLPKPQIQLLEWFTMAAIIIAIAIVRFLTRNKVQSLAGKRTLDLSALNDAIMCKEVFLAYLNAALLEPVLAIGGMEEVVGQELAINIFTLTSIFWWIWMVTDGFDYADVCQSFKYQYVDRSLFSRLFQISIKFAQPN
jgi:hypothetical protein